MNAERAWMYDQWYKPPNYGLKKEYINGVDVFLRFASANARTPGKIRCPCRKCENTRFKTIEDVKLELLKRGFMPGYYEWTSHGEEIINAAVDQSSIPRVTHDQRDRNDRVCNSFVDMVYDVAGPSFNALEPESIHAEEPNPKAKEFFSLLQSAERPLWPDCPDSALSITTKLLDVKSKHNASQSLFNDLMDVILPCVPGDHDIPKNFYKAKNLVKALGLPHERIDCCINGCMLYWKEDLNLNECKFCQHPRYKGRARSTSSRGQDVPFQRLHYLPLIPRLQRLYASEHTAKYMTWHAERSSEQGKMTHPSDSEAWKTFDNLHKQFSADARNVRLGLCIDGFQPFGKSGKNFSCWPIIVTPYNLPPWMCMKKPYMFLTLLAPGPQNPKHKIDIYMQPLIDELKLLWGEGVETYDVYKKQNFMMKAALMWTISDFPAYAMLSGWSTAGKMACPCCMDKTVGFSLENGRKVCFFDCHRKFLPLDHKYRNNKRNFKKNVKENSPPPHILTSSEVWEIVKDLPKMVETGGSIPPLPGKGQCHNWVKQSILWELPYWKTNVIRHNLDAMHIIRNVFCNVFYTVMDVKGKTKDNGASREDMKLHCKRPELHIPPNETRKPLARYELDKNRKEAVLQWVKNLKFPDGYCSNLSRCVDLKALTLHGLKSHDCHVFFLRLLPVALRDVLPEHVWSAITELSLFLKDLTSPTLQRYNIKRIDEQMPLLICNLEQIFPPAFFDSMEHLPIHMAAEALMGGPVQYRWMYPFERYLYHLKMKVKNKNRVEGSIISDYIIEETSTFCSYYFNKNNSPTDSKLLLTCPYRKKSKERYLEEMEYDAAHLFVLLNTQNLDFYQEKFWADMEAQQRVTNESSRNLLLEKDYAAWFSSYVQNPENSVTDPYVREISFRPVRTVTSYDACDVNGYVFHTVDYNKHKSTYNCGVLVKGNHVGGHGLDYYGRLLEVIELSYLGSLNVSFVLFKCEWFDPIDGVRTHRKFSSLVEVNLAKKWRSSNQEPFVFPEQACQVYYCPHPSTKRARDGWQAAIPIKARGQIDLDVVDAPYQEDTSDLASIVVEEDGIAHPLNDSSGSLVDVDMGPVRRQEEEEDIDVWHDSENEDISDEDNIDEEIFVDEDDN